MDELKVKKRYVRPDEKQVEAELKNYKSNIKLESQTDFKFEDDVYGKPDVQIAFNSLFVSDGFEIETYVEDEKIHIKFISVNSKLKGERLDHGYVELVLNSYEDLLKLGENTFTRNGITQVPTGLHIEHLLNKNRLYKKVATAGVVLGAASLIYGLFKKK